MSNFGQIARSFRIISRKAQIVYVINLIFAAILSGLDLLGITFFLLLITSSTSISSGNFLSNVPVLNDSVEVLKLYSHNHLTLMLIFTILLFTSKSFVGLLINLLNTRILNRETHTATQRLIRTIFGFNFPGKSKYSSNDYSYALNEGVRLSVLDTLYPASILFSDIFLTLLITINLVFIAEAIFIPTFLFFSTLFFLLNKVIRKLTQNSFRIAHETDLSSKQLIQESVFSSREFQAAGVSKYYSNQIDENRKIATSAYSQIAFSNMLPKYIYEVGLFFGIALIALSTKIFGEPNSILLNVSLFVLSSSRIVPALLRIQYYLTVITKATAQTAIVFEILKDESFSNVTRLNNESKILDHGFSEFVPEIKVEKVSFAYQSNPTRNVISDVSFKISRGEFLSFIGRSGSGKSTLLDLLLGSLEPATGSILVSGMDPVLASRIWPGKISYVSQKVTILSGDIYENIALGQTKDSINKDLVDQALKNVQLFDYFNSVPGSFGKNLGEFGSHLSGGQLQRIGIARAIYSDSDLMVFDESTSALDAQSEAVILDILSKYKGDKTIIMITHRLSALQKVDKIIYMDGGKILFSGNFLEAQEQVPDFAEQVKLQSFELWENENRSV